MGISGVYVDSFIEANLASCVGISLDAHYPHYFFDVVDVTEDAVILRSHSNGKELYLPIHKGKRSEYAVIDMKPRMADVFGWNAEKVKIYPIKGKRI